MPESQKLSDLRIHCDRMFSELQSHSTMQAACLISSPHSTTLWITGLLPDGMFKMNCIIPLILWLQGVNFSNSPHTLRKLSPPGITCLVWREIVRRAGGSSENATAISPPLRRFPLIHSRYLSVSQRCQECKRETLVLLCSLWSP